MSNAVFQNEKVFFPPENNCYEYKHKYLFKLVSKSFIHFDENLLFWLKTKPYYQIYLPQYCHQNLIWLLDSESRKYDLNENAVGEWSCVW